MLSGGKDLCREVPVFLCSGGGVRVNNVLGLGRREGAVITQRRYCDV